MIVLVFQQVEPRYKRWRLVSEVADRDRVYRMVGDRLAFGARDHRDRHTRPVRKRPGAGVRGGLRHRVLAAQAGQVGPVSNRRRARGKTSMCTFSGRSHHGVIGPVTGGL